MRFISQYPGYKFQVRPMRQRGMGDGSVEVLQEPIYAEFAAVHSGAMIYENEVSMALQSFEFRGNTQLQDEATPTDPLNRLAVYDTDAEAERNHWSDEEKELVETRLQQLCAEAPSECIVVSTTPISAPFPTYDTWDGPNPEMLMVKLIEDGHDLQLVLYYESVFGRKRPEIIAALEQTIEIQKETVVSA